MKKKQPTYNWKQIKQCVQDIYKVDASPDDWGVPVIYENSMLRNLQKRLKRIKDFIK